MSGQISYSINPSVYASGSQPLSGTYLQVGSVLQQINETIAAAGAVAPQANSFSAPGSSSGDLIAIFLLSSQPLTIQTNGAGTIGVQTLAIGGTPTGGTFTLAYQGQVTAPIAYNAAASAVQSALRALSTIGGTNVTCTGGALPGTPVTCTFSGTLVNQTVPLITGNIAGLTGGAPTLTIANASGTPQDVIQLAANIPLAWDINCGLACPFLGAVSAMYLTNSLPCTLKGLILTY
jgi:hypothetical protein